MQEKKKKRWYQRWWVWGIIAFLVIVIFTPAGEETVEDTKGTEETEEVKSEETKEEVAKETEETKEEAQEKEKKNNEDNEKKEKKEENEEAKTSEPVDNVAQEIVEKMALDTLEESFAGLAEVSFDRDSKLYTITPTDPAFEKELVMMNEGILGQEAWDALVDNFVFMSNNMIDVIGNGYSVALINPSNSDKYLLLLTDGKVEYDVFNE